AIGATAVGRGPGLGRAAGAGVGILLVAGTALHLAHPGHGREDVLGAAAWLETHVPREQPLLVTSSEMAYLARYHWADRRIVEYPAPRAVVTATSADEVAERLPWRDGRAGYGFGPARGSRPQSRPEHRPP